MDYGAAADEYIDAFFKNIQWEEVENRYKNTKTWKLI
jgi:superoxide dismutase